MKAVYPDLAQIRKGDEGARQQAVSLEIPVLVESVPEVPGSGARFLEETRTVVVFPQGAVVRLSSQARPGELLTVTHRWTRKRARCRVAHSKAYPNVKGYAEVEFVEPQADFWGVHFPSDPVAGASGTMRRPEPLPSGSGSPPPPPPASRPGKTAPSPRPASSAAPPTETRGILDDLLLPATPSAAAPTPAHTQIRPRPAEPPKLQQFPKPEMPHAPARPAASEKPETAEKPALQAPPGPDPRELAWATAPVFPVAPRKRSSRPWLLAGAALCVGVAAAGWWLLPGLSPLGEIEPFVLPPPGAETVVPIEPAALPETEAGVPAAVATTEGEEQPVDDPAPTTEAPAARPVPPALRMAAPVLPASVAGRTPATESAAPEVRMNGGAMRLAPGAGLNGMLPGAPAAPPPPPVKVARKVGGEIQMPRLVSSVAPVYPVLARQSGVKGDVVIEAVIEADGTVGHMKVLSGHVLLQQAATDALSRWRYEPARLNGQPAAVKLQVTIRFRR